MKLNFNLFDFLILFILCYSTLSAFFKGMIKSFFSFSGWILSFISAYYLSDPIKILTKNYIQNQLLVNVISGFIAYIFSLIVISFINDIIMDSTVNIRKGFIDRSLGIGFGLFKGSIISCVIFQILLLFSPMINGKRIDPFALKIENDNLPDFIKNAETYNLLNHGRGLIISFLPEKFMHTEIDHLKNSFFNDKKDEEKTPDNPLKKSQDSKSDSLNVLDLIKTFDSKNNFDNKIQNLEDYEEIFDSLPKNNGM